MTIPDLHTRLLAAVQQRMDVARAATPGEWEVGPTYGGVIAKDITRHVAKPLARDDSEHIAANDPAAVLRHCERDLRMLERHAPVNEWAHIPYLEPYIMCEACAEVDHDVRQPWPCPEIVLLAAAYGIEVDG